MTHPPHVSEPHVARSVEKQMRNWEIARQQRVVKPRRKARPVHDFIAMSVAVGSGGRQVVERLGHELGWPVFDKEILHAMAGDDAVRARIYETLDEHDIGWLEETIRSLVQPEFGKNDYFHRLTRTVLGLARQGSAIFVGRGADLILPRGQGLRVKVTASRDRCAARYAAENGLSEREARDALERTERDRAEFIRRHFQVGGDDAARYDLVVRLDRFSVEKAAELVLAAMRYQSPV